ncbi:MAG: DUF3014 domain-containing protein [Caldimonas sp.]
MKTAWPWIAGTAGAVLVAAAAWLWWQERAAPVPIQPPPQAAAPVLPAPAASASDAAIKYPIEASAAASSPQAPDDVASALDALFGSKTVSRMFRADDFARRFVATVDNLGRSHAPAALWPVHPADGRLVVERHGDAESIGADNGLRYTPYVLIFESLDLRRASAAYVQLYPAFQKAYEELGYPDRYFNDRFVEVLDQLMATPDPKGAPSIHVPEVNGPIQPQRPWLFYQYDQAALEALPSGQKLLLRMGPVNERRIKARLAELRRLVTAPPSAPSRPASS